MPKVELVSITSNYMNLLKLACSKPYGKDVSDKSISKIIESGHLSILEHCYASFEIKCSVRVLGQLTRHRHLSFTVKSARGSKFDTFVLPSGDTVPAEHSNTCAPYLKALNRCFNEQDAAYFLPQGIETNMIVTGNFRAWYEYLPKRLCKRAMPEHRRLAELIQKELAKNAPEIFNRDFMNCKNCTETSCNFK